MSSPTWKGYAIHDHAKWSDFSLVDFKPKTLADEDVDIKIEYCGICGTDLHVIRGAWGPAAFPLVPGHEIVGKVVNVGSKVTQFKAGDRVGVGAMIWSCNNCKLCANDNEHYCAAGVPTYHSKYPDGQLTTGGYSTGIRASERFVFPIPDGLALEQAAPLLCAGLTCYSPMVRNGAAPGRKIGIVGVGGLGHYGIQFAKALGCETYVFSHSAHKEKDAKALGADKFILTDKPENLAPYFRALDLIICTADVSSGLPLHDILQTLDVQGRLILAGLPEDKLPDLTGFTFFISGVSIGGTRVGSKKEAIDMMKLAVEKNIKGWIEVRPMSEVNEAIKNVSDNKVKYRQVLKMDIPEVSSSKY